jgi:serine protease AprX
MIQTAAVPTRSLDLGRRHRVVAGVVALALVLAASGRTAPVSSLGPSVRIVVQKLNPFDRGPERAVEKLGGTVERPLPIVEGFAARLPAGQLASLQAVSGVGNVTVNRTVKMNGQYGEDSGAASAVYTDAIGASKTWDQGYTGQGIGVALIDTGVNAVGDLAGKVLHAEDFTPEQDDVDHYGHGTFVAGLIAGQGTGSNGGVKGVAPGSHIVSVKIAGADGSTDLIRLLAALEWVVTFKDAYGIRVLNLSLGTDSTQSYRTDPLNFAVERVWNSGIAVVVAAGNRGPTPGTISKPGDDPFVITAGASDDHTTGTDTDDTLAPFSSVGPTSNRIAKPDLVAPGKSVISSRVPGSFIDTASPGGRVGTDYFKGSGTSFSSAITAGAAALVISRTWSLNPDQVKHRLVSSAHPLSGTVPPGSAGAGELDALAATMSTDLAEANDGVAPAVFAGPLLSCPRSVGIPGLAVLAGLCPFDPARYFGSSWAGSSWAGSQWRGSSWAGSQWNGSSWAGSSWAGSSWAGSQWAGSSWAASQWAGSSWAGSSWAGSSWAGSSWAGSSWAGSSWAGSSWAGSSWAGSSWAGSSWAGSQWRGSSWAELDWSTLRWSGSHWG